MESLQTPDIKVETLWRTILVTDARNSSRAYFSERANEALIRIERDRALFAQFAEAHGGEEVRDRGDGSMFAFCDPVCAVQAAMAMQKEIARLNAELPPETLRLVHRMGIQMGSIKLATTRFSGSEVTRRKLSGDIVVTAARLEEICHPGEVCFSNDVFRAVKGKIDHEFRFLDSTLKGFDRPMRCWSTRLDREWARPLTAEEEQSKERRREERRLREKWDREHREKRRRQVALQIAAAFAASSVTFATVQIVRTQTTMSGRMERAWTALLEPPPASPAIVDHPRSTVGGLEPTFVAMSHVEPTEGEPKPTRTPRKAPKPREASPAQVAATLRKALVGGQFDDIPVRLAALGMPDFEYQAACDAARRFERARDWLSARLEPAIGDETKGIPLEPPVAGFSALTRATDRGVAGHDDDDRPQSIAYLSLSPRAFGDLLRAASSDGADEPPDDPSACAASLATLQRWVHQSR